jgi:hypothetical protein
LKVALQCNEQAVIDNESRELMALHHTGFTVAEAEQIFRPTPNSDQGIDGETADVPRKRRLILGAMPGERVGNGRNNVPRLTSQISIIWI